MSYPRRRHSECKLLGVGVRHFVLLDSRVCGHTRQARGSDGSRPRLCARWSSLLLPPLSRDAHAHGLITCEFPADCANLLIPQQFVLFFLALSRTLTLRLLESNAIMMKLSTAFVASALALSAASAATTTTTEVLSAVATVSASSATGDNSSTASAGSTAGFLSTLTPKTTVGSYHMTPVRSVQARVQSDAPAWNAEGKRFVSKFYKDLDAAFVGAMDSVNTASVEGALMYVQAEGINYKTRSTENRCVRKSSMAYVVFYDIAITQTNETLALYQETADQNEYGPMIPMDSGRCTPLSGSGASEVFPTACSYFNGDNGQPNVGPFIGGESKLTDPRAPYADNVWFSFPNTCPLSAWSNKTTACRAATRKGLCDRGVLPNGVDCTYNYRILGYVAIDDLVGITSMVSNSTNKPYGNFTEFCQDGGVEFMASEDGVWEESIDFWRKPQDESANKARAKLLVEAYQNLTSGAATSGQIASDVVAHMLPLPTVAALTAENPPCYKNVAKCNTKYGCKRDKYAQLCTVCTSADDGCVAPPSSFTFPTLAKAVGANGNTGSANASNSTSGGNTSGGSSTTSVALSVRDTSVVTLVTTVVIAVSAALLS